MIKICTHTRYKGVRRPKTACEYCWFTWFTQGGSDDYIASLTAGREKKDG